MKVSLAVMTLVALLAAAPASLSAGTSFLDYASTNYTEEPSAEQPSYLVPENFPGPLAPQPRRKPEPGGMLLACLGLIVYLGRRRSKALAAAAA